MLFVPASAVERKWTSKVDEIKSIETKEKKGGDEGFQGCEEKEKKGW